ncbi:hypothetical protein B7463_g7829, partial [Scytalidium lignicola]
MGDRVIVVQLSPTDKETRDMLLKYLQETADHAVKNEPGTLKYSLATSRDESDLSLYVIEEYADQTAFDFHMQQDGVQAMGKWMSAGGLDSAPTIWELEHIDGFNFTRPEVTRHADPFVIFTEIDYKPDTGSSTLPYWKAVVEAGENDELGTLVYGICRDPKNADKLFVVHAYESRDYLMDVHVPNCRE